MELEENSERAESMSEASAVQTKVSTKVQSQKRLNEEKVLRSVCAESDCLFLTVQPQQ